MISIRGMEKGDLGAVAGISKYSYNKDHFTSRFSISMLKTYYLEVLKLNKYAFVAVDSANEVVGFVIGGENTKISIRNYIKKNLLKLASVLIFNPTFIIPKLKGLFSQKSSRSSKVKLRLLSIAVSDKAKESGVGGSLVESFESKLAQDGVNVYGLSVHKSNLKAIRFYEKSGYMKEFESNKAIYYLKYIK